MSGILLTTLYSGSYLRLVGTVGCPHVICNGCGASNQQEVTCRVTDGENILAGLDLRYCLTEKNVKPSTPHGR